MQNYIELTAKELREKYTFLVKVKNFDFEIGYVTLGDMLAFQEGKFRLLPAYMLQKVYVKKENRYYFKNVICHPTFFPIHEIIYIENLKNNNTLIKNDNDK